MRGLWDGSAAGPAGALDRTVTFEARGTLGSNRKSWKDLDDDLIRVVSHTSNQGAYDGFSARRRLPKVAPGLGECLAYPLKDAPGLVMLVIWPPLLFFLSLPIFDIMAILEPVTRGKWAIGLLALPIFLPLMIVFALTFGYSLLFFGQMLVTSALGENDHPTWPEWNSHQIAEGLTRYVWAGIFGLLLGGFPVMVYWKYCGDIDWFDRVVFFDLAVLGVAYALMTLASALLHDSLIAANPIRVIASIFIVGWDFVQPCVAASVGIGVSIGVLWLMLFQIESMKVSFVMLWLDWVFILYVCMVAVRMVGLVYHAHSEELVWFRIRPKWGLPKRYGRIYSNM